MALKGQFYSLIAIVIAIPIMLFIAGNFLSVSELKSSTTEKIVSDQLQLVEESIEDDFSKGVEIGVKRALLTMTDFVITNGSFFNTTPAPFLELLVDGTLYGQAKYLMINNTLTEWKYHLLNVSTGFNVDFNFTYPTGTWSGTNLYGTYGLTIKVSDQFDISRIEKTNARKNVTISIEGMEDPLFPLNTFGLVRRTYKEYPYSLYAKKFAGTGSNKNFIAGNVTFSGSSPDTSKIYVTNIILPSVTGWGCIVGQSGKPTDASQCYVTGVSSPVTNINNTINSLGGYAELYIDNATNAAWILPLKVGVNGNLYFKEFGPNIFERLEGVYNSTSGNPQFITFVNTDELMQAGVTIDNVTTRVEWIYFGGSAIAGRGVRGMPSWFRVDSEYAGIFNLTELLQ